MIKYVRDMGLHLMLTLVDCDVAILTNKNFLYTWLRTFPPKINMSLINVEPNPVIYSCYSEQNPDNYGFSGFCLLHESHVSIHCWPIEHTVDVDVFSCYQFNNEMALKYIENSFRGKAVNVSVCQRGHGMRNKHEIY